MASYRILIVDDQHEMRDMLRSAVETLDSDLKVVVVPSGEEALLEIHGQTFDLLVSDVLLPGITGLELVKKVKARNPDLKVILVTGILDRQLRRDVADAGADAFFLKPMEPADFLDAVERSLGLVESTVYDQGILDSEKPAENVSEHLVSLRQELDAISAVLLDDRGRILAQAGDLPDASVESSLFPSLMASFSASGRVARFLGSNPPNDLLYFSGPKYDIILAHVGESYALVVAVNPIAVEDEVSTIVRVVYAGVGDLLDILHSMGIKMKSESRPLPEDFESDDEIFREEAPIIDALFQNVASNVPEAEEIDAFWSTVAEGEAADGVQNAGALTYEQALQLGLAPDEGDD